jgi:hypothetical protein
MKKPDLLPSPLPALSVKTGEFTVDTGAVYIEDRSKPLMDFIASIPYGHPANYCPTAAVAEAWARLFQQAPRMFKLLETVLDENAPFSEFGNFLKEAREVVAEVRGHKGGEHG